MNIALFGKSFSAERSPFFHQLINRLSAAKVNLMVYKPYADMLKPFVQLPEFTRLFESHHDINGKADLLFSIGGDGTMLDTVPIVRNSGIPVLGINMGRMGFLSSIAKQDIDQAIDQIINHQFSIESRSLISLQNPQYLFGELNFALNELSVFRHETTSLIVIQVFVDDVFVNSYWADGLIIATPTGSTAYSLSAGGPILTPASANFVITPIATHNLSVRPIVIPDNSNIRLMVTGRHSKFVLSMDSRSEIIEKSTTLEISKADFNMQLVKMEGKDFFATIREKLLWGLDIRN